MSGCACSGLGGDTTGQRFPTVEKVLAKYIADCLKSGMPFWISDQLNSDVLAHMKTHADAIVAAAGDLPQGFGQLEFIPAIISAIAGVASTVGSTVIAVAPAIASIAGTAASLNTINNANSQLSSGGQRIAIPQTAATSVVSAVQNDIGGIPTNTVLLMGAGALLLVVLLRK